MIGQRSIEQLRGSPLAAPAGCQAIDASAHLADRGAGRVAFDTRSRRV
jgi:hypothetical protein